MKRSNSLREIITCGKCATNALTPNGLNVSYYFIYIINKLQQVIHLETFNGFRR